MLLVLLVLVVMVLVSLVRSLLVSVQLVSLFNSFEESSARLVASEMKNDAVESARTLVARFVETNEVVWLNNRCEMTGGSTRVRVLQLNGLTAVLKDCVSNAIYTVNVEDMIQVVR